MLTKFYKEINNGNYISLKKKYYIQEKYITYYKNIKKQKHKTKQEKIFLKDFKNIDEFIEEHNNKYIREKRIKTLMLDNIKGYKLDDYQSRVVLSEEEATLVVAGAGSGKSLTIIAKIVYLVTHCNINPNDILCISFTNDATINLKNNISKNYNFDIEIYTFHKLALEILKQNHIDYQIAPDNYLNKIIDDFFNNIIPNNKIYIKSLSIILGSKFTSKDILNLKRLIVMFINLFKSNNYKLSFFITVLKRLKFTFNIKEYIRNKYLILIIFNIYILYEKELSNENAIDFNDMINKSIESIKKNGLNKKWKYIIVDEYQDTSITKFNMIKEILNITNAKFLAVGDDFQSIYRFTGCDLKIFLNFTKYFKYSKIFSIVNTYRNPQELIDVAGSFVMKNKAQQRKVLKSPKNLNYPIIIYYEDNKIKALKDLLKYLGCNNQKIMVLGRNNKDIYNYIDDTFSQEKDIFIYQNIHFRYLTIHKSKGLESDNVILINMENNLLGMPTKIKNEKILKYVNDTKDYFPYEEERRLFYVALTRTKNRTYIISPTKKESVFITEIKKYTKKVKQIKSKH